MGTRKAAGDGSVSDDILNHYSMLSEGAGIVVIEHTYVSDLGRAPMNQLGVSHDRFIPGLMKLSKTVHDNGATVVLQINHVGYNSRSQVTGRAPMAPSAIRNLRDEKGEVPKPMTRLEIQEQVEAFASAAARAVKAGFDGVEVHCSHGFLLGEFLSPLTNKRTDEYGGDTENRIRFPAQVIRSVRQSVGSNYPVFCRFPASDVMPGGLELPEVITMAKTMVKAGVDVVDIGGGVGGIEPSGVKEQGFFVPQAEAVKKATGAVVIGVGGIVDPDFADRVVREGRVDLVAVGRPLLKDSQWFRKAIRTLTDRT